MVFSMKKFSDFQCLGCWWVLEREALVAELIVISLSPPSPCLLLLSCQATKAPLWSSVNVITHVTCTKFAQDNYQQQLLGYSGPGLVEKSYHYEERQRLPRCAVDDGDQSSVDNLISGDVNRTGEGNLSEISQFSSSNVSVIFTPVPKLHPPESPPPALDLSDPQSFISRSWAVVSSQLKIIRLLIISFEWVITKCWM